MKILVATGRAQAKEGDYCATIEGEPVLLPMICDRDELTREEGTLGCGCSRAFGGMSSSRVTTTARVMETPLTRSELLVALHGALSQVGLAPEEQDMEQEDWEAVEQELDDLLRLADAFELGEVIERDFDELRART